MGQCRSCCAHRGCAPPGTDTTARGPILHRPPQLCRLVLGAGRDRTLLPDTQTKGDLGEERSGKLPTDISPAAPAQLSPGWRRVGGCMNQPQGAWGWRGGSSGAGQGAAGRDPVEQEVCCSCAQLAVCVGPVRLHHWMGTVPSGLGTVPGVKMHFSLRWPACSHLGRAQGGCWGRDEVRRDPQSQIRLRAGPRTPRAS